MKKLYKLFERNIENGLKILYITHSYLQFQSLNLYFGEQHNL